MGTAAVEISNVVPDFAIAMIMVLVEFVTTMGDKRRAKFVRLEDCGNVTVGLGVWDE